MAYDLGMLWQGARFGVHAGTMVAPDGTERVYEWVSTPDLVRVAALDDAGGIYVISQHHHLPGRVMWQLPGGAVDPGETPLQAARRELAEETGVRAERWEGIGAVWPMPGLTPARVHLFRAEGLSPGPAAPGVGEDDLVAEVVTLREARDAALSGLVGCAASAQLILAMSFYAVRRMRPA